jgi:putative hydrolase of the HAD superfamily
MLRAVVFDMDETLVDWSGRSGDWTEHNQQHLKPVHEYLHSAGHAVPELAAFAKIYSEQSYEAWQESMPPEWNCPRQIDIMRSTLRAAGLDAGAIDVQRLQSLFAWDVIPGVRLFDDTVPVLCTLREAGVQTGLVTNTAFPMWMRDVELQSLGLLRYLDVRVTAGDVGKLKPHPRPFKEVLKRLGVEPEEAVFVGDRLHDDIMGAQGAGMRAIWVRRATGPENGTAKPNATIDRLRALLEILDLWFPGWR